MIRFKNENLILNTFPGRIELLNLMVLLFLFRSSIPEFKYPFLIFYFYFISITFFTKSIKVENLKSFLITFILVLILAAFYFQAIFRSDKLFLDVFKDSLNMVILLSFFFFISISIKSKKEYLDYYSSIINSIIVFSVIISLLGIYHYYQIFFTDEIIRFSDKTLVDYNFALLPVFFGMLSVLYRLPNIKIQPKIVLYNLLLLVFTIQIFLSRSRRGFIILNILLLLLYLMYGLSLIYKKNEYLQSLSKGFKYYLVLITIFFGLGYMFIFSTSYTFKQKSFEKIGIKKITTFQENLSEKLYRYSSVFNNKLTLSAFYRKIWAPEYDPKDPDSGWGTRIHKTIYPLVGDNVEIVPPSVKGYFMDSTCNAYLMNGNAYSFTELFLFDTKVKSNDLVTISAYCYVSIDFDGAWSLIALTNNSSNWLGSEAYDLEKKGTWQKLVLSRTCEEGDISAYLYFCKTGVNDFSSMKGHVIFAFPQCKINSVNDTITTGNILKTDFKNSTNYFNPRVKLNPFEANFLSSIMLLKLGNQDLDRDIIRRLASRVISEDTTYYGYKSDLIIDSIKNSFLDLRYSRWQFASQIFVKEYNWKQKVFGGGFNHLNWYGYYFLKDKTAVDWPHNPFLSILLYSGIFGLLIYCWFMYKVFYYYIKYIKEYPLLFIFFLITFFFSFFSGGSPFDPPIMGFFSILPFFIHSIHKKDKSEQLDRT